jgi:uncharacterized protein YjbJ (UPF0337 family)
MAFEAARTQTLAAMWASAQTQLGPLPSICSWVIQSQRLTRRSGFFISIKETIMNKNQVHGAVKDLAGKVQEEAGKLVGNKVQEAKGLQKQVAGKAEVHLGDAKEAVKDAKEVVKGAGGKQ